MKVPKRRWIILLLAVIVIAAVGAGVAWQRNKHRSTRTAIAATVRTASVQKRTVSSSIDAVGELQAMRQEALYAKVAGKVTELLVKPGDMVKSGQVLARLSSEDAELAVADAKDALALARSKLTSAQDAYKNAPQNAEMQLQKARQDYLNAKLKVDELAAGPKPEEVEQYRSSLRQAQLNLHTAEADAANQEILYKAKAISRTEYEQSTNAVTIARDNVTNAQLKLDALLKGADQKEKDAAAAALKQAEINLRLAENDYAKAASQDAVIQAEADVRNAEKALRTAEENLASLTIKAPFAGMVLATNAVVGQEKAAGSASDALITLSAPDRWQVMAYVDESDLSKLHSGQRAQITLSAMEDRNFNASLTAIGGESKTSQGVVTYPIYLALETYNPLFRPGMSADVLVQLVYRPNVLAVPDAAIVERRGKTMVQVQENGATSYVEVEVGEKGNGYTEIVSGLTEGQTIVLPGRTGASQPSRGPQNQNGRQQNVRVGGAPAMMMIPR